MKKDYYKILGLPKTATAEEIKKTYRKLAFQYHPDTSAPGDNNEEKFKEVSEAYEILGDENKRAEYDRPKSQEHAWNFGGGFPFSSNDPFAQFQEQVKKRRSKGETLQIYVFLTLEESIQGCTKKIKIKRKSKCIPCDGNGSLNGSSFQNCAKCAGTGMITQTHNTAYGQFVNSYVCDYCQGLGKIRLEHCHDCFGKGYAIIEEIIPVNFHPGFISGMQFIVEHKGNDDMRGGSPGDLLINIREKEHELYSRVGGHNIKLVKEISFADACLGTTGEVEIPLGQKVNFKIGPGTIPGTIIQFHGKGIPTYGNGQRGDFLVELTIKIAQPQNDEERKILEDLRKNEFLNPHA